MRSSASSSSQQLTLKALARALLPIVRVFQMGGFGVGEFGIAVRLAFVQAASIEGRTKGGRTNVSRIATMTGLTRKEVRQLLHILDEGSRLVPRSRSRQRTARVLDAWRTYPLYLDDRGRPQLLTLDGADPSFRSLVRSYAGDVTPVSVLRELERTGAVRVMPDGKLRCRTPRESNTKVDGAFLLEFAQRLQDFATVMAAGAEVGGSSVYYGIRVASLLMPEQANEFLRVFTERGTKLLDHADNWVAKRKPRAWKAYGAGPAVDVRLGIFLTK